MTRSEEEVIPSCSNDTEDNKIEKGTVPMSIIGSQSGFICPDAYCYSSGREPADLLYLKNTSLHSEKELGLKFGDRIIRSPSLTGEVTFDEAKDVRMIDNG